jgi:hypothetical protein
MAIKRPISEEIVVKLWQVEVLMGQGVLSYIRADNGSELIAEAVRDWIKAVGAKTAHISSQCRHRRTATAKASMEGCETNCSMARSFTRYVKTRSSLEDEGTITTPNDYIVLWATATSSRDHLTDGATANHALTFNMEHSSGAAHIFHEPIC